MSKPISSGSRKDLLVMYFCCSVIKVSLKDVKKLSKEEKEELQERDDNKNHHLNKRIDRRLKKLLEKMEVTINAMMANYETALWVRKHLDSKIGKTLMKMQNSIINLEMLALWILYVNFVERDKPLDKVFEWLTDAELYFEITEMMADTKVSYLESELFNMAYDVVKMIKG